MTGRDKESQEIMGAAMQYVKTGDRTKLESFSLTLLKKADYQLSNRDVGSGYRRAIKNLIAEIDINHNPHIQSNFLKKTWHDGYAGKLIVGFSIGVPLIFIAYFVNNMHLIDLTGLNNAQDTKVYNIEIPISIESTWGEYSDLDRKAEFYIVKSESPGSQSVIYSGSAKVLIPKDGLIVNEMISITPNQTTKTAVTLPKVKVLNEYLEEGGYEIQLLLFNRNGYVFTHKEQKLFDKEILKRGFSYWFRLMPKQISNKSFKRDLRYAAAT